MSLVVPVRKNSFCFSIMEISSSFWVIWVTIFQPCQLIISFNYQYRSCEDDLNRQLVDSNLSTIFQLNPDKMKRFTLLFLFVLIAANTKAQSGVGDRILGIWKSPRQNIVIKVDRIGDIFQGRIVWVGIDDKEDMAFDVNNPIERLRSVPLKGNKMIRDLIYNPQESVWVGAYYDFNAGELYRCKVTLNESDQIRITRYISNQKDEETEVWTRKQ